MILNMTITGTSSTKSIMIISAEHGSEVAVYSNAECTTKVKDAVEKNEGEFWVTDLNNGDYYIKATSSDNTQTKILPYNINEYGVYRISIFYFNTTITVTYPTAAASLTLTDDITTYTATDFSSGSYTFTVHNTGTWKAEAIVNGYSMTATFEVTASEQSFSDSCKLIIVNGDYYNANALGGWHSLYSSGTLPTIENTSTGIHIANASTSTYRYYGGNNAINLTPFSTFHARGYRTISSSSNGLVGVSKVYNFSSSSNNISYSSIPYSSSGTYSDVNYDLTSETSEKWLFFGTSGTTGLYLSELWVE